MPRPKKPRARLVFVCLLAFAAGVGCESAKQNPYKSVAAPPSVEIVKPQTRTVVRRVGQPSFVDAYERTSIYPKLSAYIKDWVADIGDRVRKNDVLATLFVPELMEEFATKQATVKLDEERVRLAQQVVKVAQADVDAAAARLEEAKQILGKYDAEVERWDSEVKRLQREVDRNVVAPQILLESKNQLKSSTAAREAAKATIDTAKSDLAAAQATLEKDRIDVAVAKADLAVATSDWKRTGALVGYLTLRAPFDGVIYERNANTFDFVLPTTGDPTANRRSPDISSARAAPVYVVDRTDIVRIFVDVPERDADFVHAVELRLLPDLKNLDELPARAKDQVCLARIDGKLHVRVFDSDGKQLVNAGEDEFSKAGPPLEALKSLLAGEWDAQTPMADAPEGSVVWDQIPGRTRQVSPIVKQKLLEALAALFGSERVPFGTRADVLVKGYRDEPIEGTVTRTAWALNVVSRTLRAEIDLANPDARILPGMYAYANVVIEHANVSTLPESALSHVGDHIYCWLYRDGKAVRTEVRTGISDGTYVEVTSLLTSSDPRLIASWTPPTGSEQVIMGDLSSMVDGVTVQVSPGDDARPAGKPLAANERSSPPVRLSQ